MTNVRRRSRSPGQRAVEIAGALTLLWLAVTSFLFSTSLQPLVQFLMGRYFALFLPALAITSTAAPNIDLARTAPANFAAAVVFAAVVILVWRWAIRTVRHQLAAGKSLQELRTLSPDAFEEWVAARFRDLGFRVRLTGTAGDHGIDLVAEKIGERAIVQCKRYSGSIGEPVLRDLFGAMHSHGADRAYLATTGHLTGPAYAWVRDKPIEIWDGERLAQLSVQLVTKPGRLGDRRNLVGAPISTAHEPKLAITTDAHPDATVGATATCPKCASALVERRNRRTGDIFLGCPRYPTCRHTQPLPA